MADIPMNNYDYTKCFYCKSSLTEIEYSPKEGFFVCKVCPPFIRHKDFEHSMWNYRCIYNKGGGCYLVVIDRSNIIAVYDLDTPHRFSLIRESSYLFMMNMIIDFS